MKLYDVMKKWATDPDERFYCYQTDEIWRLEGNDMMNEEDEIRVVNKYTLNFNFEEIKEPVTFMEAVESGKRIKVMHDNCLSLSEGYQTLSDLLDEIVNEIGYELGSEYVARILTEGKFYVEED